MSYKPSYSDKVRAERGPLELAGYLGDVGVNLEKQGEWLTDSTWTGRLDN